MLRSLLFCLLLTSTLLSFSQNKKKDKSKKNTEVNTEKSSETEEKTILEKPTMKVQLGYTGYVNDFALSHDGKFVVVNASDYSTKIWEVATARELLTLPRDSQQLAHIQFSQNDQFLFMSYGRDEMYLHIIDASSGKKVASRNVSVKTYFMTQILPNNKELIYIDRGAGIGNRIYHDPISIGKTLHTFQTETPIYRFKVSQDGKYLWAQTAEKFFIWEINSGKLLNSVVFKTTQTEEINSNQFHQSVPFFSPDNQYVYFEDENSIKRYSIASATVENTSIKAEGNNYMAFSEDGKKLIITSSDETDIRQYSLTPVIKALPSLVKYSYMDKISISYDGSYFTSNHSYFRMRIGNCNLNTDTLDTEFQEICFTKDNALAIGLDDGKLFQLETNTGRKLKEFKGVALGLNFARFSNDAQSAFWIQDSTKVVRWNMMSGNLMREYEGHTDKITKIAFSSDGKYLATAAMDKSIKLWEIETGKLIRTHSVYTKWISALEFSPDNAFIAAQAEELTFKVWDVKSGKEFKKFKGHTERVTCLEFTADSKSIISGAWDQTIRIWNISTSTQTKLINGFEHPITALELCQDGKTLAVGGGEKRFGTLYYEGENKIALFDITTGTLKKKFQNTPNGNVIQFAFSPDQQFLLSRYDVGDRIPTWEIVDLSSHYTQDFTLYSIATGEIVLNFAGNHQDMKKLFLPNGKLLYATDDNAIGIWDLGTRQTTAKLQGHMSHVSNISCTNDGKQLLSRSTEEGIIKFWDIDTKQNVLNFIALGGRHNDYLIVSPENYYMCSKGGANAVHFVLNKHAYEFAQFDLQYNRPDKVLSNIKGIDPELINSFQKAYQKRLKKADFSEEMFGSDLHLPIVSLTTPKSLISKTREYTLTIKASDSKFTLDRILISINDVPVLGSKGIELKALKSKTHEKTLTLKLSSGENHIRVSCINAKGVESLAATADVMCNIPEYKPTLYLITVGVSNFKDARMNLQYAAKDATDIQQLLGQSSSSYAAVKSFSMINEKATKENILAVKSQLMSGNPDDVVLFMVSSHGILNEELDYYIATYDMDFSNPSARGLSYESLESILDGIPQRKKILFMDACHSGEVDKEEMQLVKNETPTESGDLTFRALPGTGVKKIGTENTFEMMKELFADLRKGSGATIISSAGGGEYAIEGEQWSNGVFTFCLINALKDKQADYNKDSQITISELQYYLFQKVPKLTNNKQKPTFRAENIRFDFPIWK